MDLGVMASFVALLATKATFSDYVVRVRIVALSATWASSSRSQGLGSSAWWLSRVWSRRTGWMSPSCSGGLSRRCRPPRCSGGSPWRGRCRRGRSSRRRSGPTPRPGSRRRWGSSALRSSRCRSRASRSTAAVAPPCRLGYAVAAVGAVIVVIAGATRSLPLVFLGCLLVGVASASALQARYAATDLADGGAPGPGAVVRRLGRHGRRGPRAEPARGLRRGRGRPRPAAADRPLPPVLPHARGLGLRAAGVPAPGPLPPRAVARAARERRRGDRAGRGCATASSTCAAPAGDARVIGVALGHVVMVMVMVMTPVHMATSTSRCS